MEMIVCSQVHLSYITGAGKVEVLRGVDMVVQQGEHVAIVGPSGAGKSTLLRLCAALDWPDSGHVRIARGIVTHELRGAALARFRREQVGLVFQQFSLLPSLTALENVMVPAEIRGENHARSRAGDLLKQVGLDGRLNHYPVQLSGGEQQRVAIARAFINQPKILFADEPTGNLDAETASDIIKLIFDLNATRGTTLLLVTHDQELSRQAGRLIQLRGGRIALDSADTKAARTSA